MNVNEEADRFAADLQRLLDSTLPGQREIVAEQRDERYAVHPAPVNGSEAMPVLFDHRPLAILTMSYLCSADREGRYLVIDSSRFWLRSSIDREPLVRLEFQHLDHPNAPTAHWHFHAERGSFSTLLTAGKARSPHSLSSVHLPVGGYRMRPCFEDFIEFLIRECGADPKPGWEQTVVGGRETWRRLQLASLIRDAPQQVVAALSDRGFVITPPTSGLPAPRPESFRVW